MEPARLSRCPHDVSAIFWFWFCGFGFFFLILVTKLRGFKAF